MRAAFVSLALGMAASARPMRRDATALANGQAAITLNAQFQTLTSSSPCTEGEDACVNGEFSQCVNGAFVSTVCAAGTICAAIPLESPSSGTITQCTTQTDLDTRLAATGATSDLASAPASASVDTASASASTDSASTSIGDASASSTDSASISTSTDSASASTSTDAAPGNNVASGGSATSGADSSSTGTGATDASSIGALSTTDITTNATLNNPDAQSSLTLDARVIATGFMQNGQNVQEAGQVASLTSNNNFINYCLTLPNTPITNGLQILTGSCNPAPIGTIPAVTDMPSAKFSNPANGATIAANTDFTITMNIKNIVTGNFVNADESYFAAPQQLSGGLIVGHSHFVIEQLTSLGQTTPTNPQVFAFFKGVNTPAADGVLSVDVTDGIPDGAYRLCSINSSANHQPVIVPVAQHGALDDCVYFTASGDAAGNSTGQAAAASDSANPAAGAAAAAVTAFDSGSESTTPAASTNASAADASAAGSAAVVAQPATASPEASANLKASAKSSSSSKSSSKKGGKRMVSRARL